MIDPDEEQNSSLIEDSVSLELLVEAADHRREGRLMEAINIYSRVIQLHSDNCDVYLLLIRSLWDARLYSRVVEVGDEALLVANKKSSHHSGVEVLQFVFRSLLAEKRYHDVVEKGKAMLSDATMLQTPQGRLLVSQFVERTHNMIVEEEHAVKERERRRSEILAIMKNDTITPAERQKLIQNVHTKHSSLVSDKEPSDTPQRILTFHEANVLGCSHYKRGCRLIADCCKRVYTCRICHDENENHKIDRHATTTVFCMSCRQDVACAKVCSNCDTMMARYYCDVCKFFDDEEGRDIYHCDKCGLCRRGTIGEFVHCDRCGICRNRGDVDHACFDLRDHSECPVCREELFSSRSPACYLPCGHAMHAECKIRYVRTSYRCPLCQKTVHPPEVTAELWSHFDEELSCQPMPPMYSNCVATIFCNDCEKRSQAPYHFLHHKCAECDSYNTQFLSKESQ